MNTQTTRPQSATEFLATAASTLGERGKQYDPNGKQERSMTAIVAAFNAIYHHNPLTVHMGWQFMSLVKMVRGATKPHADSALDQVAYAALAAECVAEQLHQPVALCEDEGCPHHGTPHVCVTSVETTAHFAGLGTVPTTAGYARVPVRVAQAKPYVDPMIGGQTDYERWQGAEAALRSMRTSRDVWKRDYGTIHKKLANQVHKERDIAAKAQLEVTRLRGKVQELANLAEYRDKRNAELCAELESKSGKCIAQSSRISELQTLVDNLRSSLAQATKEAPCAHNTDEPKAPRPEYVDPYDSHGGQQPAPVHRLVGGLDPARGGLAYPKGKDAPTPL